MRFGSVVQSRRRELGIGLRSFHLLVRVCCARCFNLFTIRDVDDGELVIVASGRVLDEFWRLQALGLNPANALANRFVESAAALLGGFLRRMTLVGFTESRIKECRFMISKPFSLVGFALISRATNAAQ